MRLLYVIYTCTSALLLCAQLRTVIPFVACRLQNELQWLTLSYTDYQVMANHETHIVLRIPDVRIDWQGKKCFSTSGQQLPAQIFTHYRLLSLHRLDRTPKRSMLLAVHIPPRFVAIDSLQSGFMNGSIRAKTGHPCDLRHWTVDSAWPILSEHAWSHVNLQVNHMILMPTATIHALIRGHMVTLHLPSSQIWRNQPISYYPSIEVLASCPQVSSEAILRYYEMISTRSVDLSRWCKPWFIFICMALWHRVKIARLLPLDV